MKKQEIADKVYEIMIHTNQYKWNILFGYDCIHITLNKDNRVPLYTDTTNELEKALNNEVTVIEVDEEGNLILMYDVGIIDEQNEVWEYEYKKLINIMRG